MSGPVKSPPHTTPAASATGATPAPASPPDRRRWPCNGRVASVALMGRAEAERFVEGTVRCIAHPIADLRARPGGPRDRQMLLGELVRVYEMRQGWAFIEAARDGYTGYLKESDLEALPAEGAPDHVVAVPATHLYTEADLKSPDITHLSLGARVKVEDFEGKWARTSHGHVFARHLRPLLEPVADPVAVAESLIGTPYLWGGNSRDGIDCSGLVQAGCLMAGIACPGDSDMQSRELGHPLPEGAPYQRGDLIFWKGHVAWVTDPTTLIHANGNDMAVAYEGITEAIARIEDAGEGPVTQRRRL